MEGKQMKNKYIVIIQDSVNYNISEDFATIEEAVDYGIRQNYGKGFEIAKRVDYKITQE